MRNLLLLFLCLLPLTIFSQQWTKEQLAAANTAGKIPDIGEEEKDVIAYINLARMYPKQFAKQEVANYTATEVYGDQLIHSKYRQSLIEELNKLTPMAALTFDREMYVLAACFARESGEKGLTGHERIKCKTGYMAECCSYGMTDAEGIAMQWLIDDNIKSLGHRKICLDRSLKAVGIAYQTHSSYHVCAVADFK